MKEKATIYDLRRMCDFYKDCTDCPLREMDCDFRSLAPDIIDKTNKIILKWCKEHPVKTRQDKFLEMFPDAKMCDEAIDICPSKLGYKKRDCGGKDCIECKRKYWLEEVEDDERA